MANKKGRGLLMVWADISEDKQEEFNRWYNEEHLAELLAIPGFLNGARYEAVRGSPKYLACYELENVEVMQSDAYVHHQQNPTEWSQRMSPRLIGTNFVGNVYQQIFPEVPSTAQDQREMAPALQIGRMGIPAPVEDEFNHWYNTVYIPGYEQVPGCISGRRYSAARGEPKYCTVYEFEDEHVSLKPEWDKARDANPQSAEMRTLMVHVDGSPGVYNRVFQL